MICYDAFFLSHTYEPVDIPDQEDVDKWLPEYQPEFFLDPKNPSAFNGLVMPDNYMEMRYKLQQAHEKAKTVVDEVGKSFGETFGRPNGAVEAVNVDDADMVVITSSSMTSPARLVTRELREKGKKIGLLKIRMFRPFPTEAVRRLLHGKKKAVVIDRNCSWGKGGIFADEIRSVMANSDASPRIYSFIAGLGGRSITPDLIYELINEADTGEPPEELSVWKGMKQ